MKLILDEGAMRVSAISTIGLLLCICHPLTAQPFREINPGLPQKTNGNISWADYDGDGDMDFFHSGSTPVGAGYTRLFSNNGTFVLTPLRDSFLDFFQGRSTCTAWADFDEDGDVDAVLSGAFIYFPPTSYTGIYRNDGDGNFTDIGAVPLLDGLSECDVDWGDWDSDGDLDLAVVGMREAGGGLPAIPTSGIWRNNGDETFTYQGLFLGGTGYGSLKEFGDYDNDSEPDLLITGTGDNGVLETTVYRNDGGLFTDIHAYLTPVTSGNAKWGDYDNDGFLDILLVGATVAGKTSRIYRNLGDGRFVNIGANLADIGDGFADWGDFDNDGDLDILIAGLSENDQGFLSRVSTVYRNDGDGQFSDLGDGLIGVEGGSGGWGDFDGDGDLDIILEGRFDFQNYWVTLFYENQLISAGATASEDPIDLPAEFVLEQSYPNPFNPSTIISYGLDRASSVRLEVYDPMGRRVATLVNGYLPAGEHSARFDAAARPSGLYLYRLITPEKTLSRKMHLIR